uniref:Uncharacterized protein n=1 Tax=Zea mays TaxID=4577 RepID=C0PEX2_MAIZE|nr:unknown [Zea mays]
MPHGLSLFFFASLELSRKIPWCSWPFLVTLILISSLMYSIPLFCVNVCMRCVIIYGIEYGGLKRGCSSLCVFFPLINAWIQSLD